MPNEIIAVTDAQRNIRKAQIKTEKIMEFQQNETKKKSPFKKWTQLNNDPEAQEARYWLMKVSSDAYCVMDFLASNMDRYNAVLCSSKVIEEKLGYSRSTVARAIKLLKDHRYIDIKKSGTSNVYLLNKRLYWNSWGENYAHAEFTAKVIISASEQDEETRNDVILKVKNQKKVSVKSDE